MSPNHGEKSDKASALVGQPDFSVLPNWAQDLAAALSSGKTDKSSDEATPPSQSSAKGKVAEQTPELAGAKESPFKSMAQAVSGMVKETKLGKAKDLLSVVKLSLKDTRDADDPDWYSSQAMFWTAHPWRLARAEWVKQLIQEHKDWITDDCKDGKFKALDYGCGNGIASNVLLPHVSEIVAMDNDLRLVKIYNEIVKRQGHAAGIEAPMQAYHGDLMPDFPSRKVHEVTNKSLLKAFEHDGFNIVVVMLAMDCFEILSLSADDRLKQLMVNLDQLIHCLQDHGTLLILDFQKATTQKNVGINGLADGHKPNGYHSETIVDALKHLSVTDIEVKDGLRFQLEATEFEKPLWVPNQTDEAWFMLKATKKPQGFQGAFFGGNGEMLDPGSMTGDMAEAMLMAMMSAHGHEH
ncbi:MAG: hypothetical protein Q9221_005009 [Calogaya cf. arnoldii]